MKDCEAMIYSNKKKAKRTFVVDGFKQYQDSYISREAHMAAICHKYTAGLFRYTGIVYNRASSTLLL